MRVKTVKSRDSISARSACAGRAVSSFQPSEGIRGSERSEHREAASRLFHIGGSSVRCGEAIDGQDGAGFAKTADDAFRSSDSSSGAHGFERAMRYATAALDRRLVGREFGGYRLARVLGQGRFGTGFLARPMRGGVADAQRLDSEGGMRVANNLPDEHAEDVVFMKLVKRRRVKQGGACLRSETTDDLDTHTPSALSRCFASDQGGSSAAQSSIALDMRAVWAECAALSLCDHPGIPQWQGIVNERGRYFIVESLMPGRSLASWLAEGRVFSREEIVAIGLVLIDITEHAASRGVVHNDIRPANVLIDERPYEPVKVLGHNVGEGELAPHVASRHEAVSVSNAAEDQDAAEATRLLAMPATREAQARVRVSLIDFGLAEFFDRALPEGDRMAACVPDMAGIAEVIIGLLYSNRMNIRATVARDAPWFDALILTPGQKSVLEDMFLGRIRSFDALRARFIAAFNRYRLSES